MVSSILLGDARDGLFEDEQLDFMLERLGYDDDAYDYVMSVAEYDALEAASSALYVLEDY